MSYYHPVYIKTSHSTSTPANVVTSDAVAPDKVPEFIRDELYRNEANSLGRLAGMLSIDLNYSNGFTDTWTIERRRIEP